MRWRLRLFEFGFDVLRHTGIKYQAADALSRLATIEENQAPIEDDLLNVVHKITSETKAGIQLVLHTTVLSDGADSQSEAQVGEESDAEKREAAPTLHKGFYHQETDSFCTKGCRKCWPSKYRVYRL